jgi:2'-5' RNA ligase
MSSGSALVITFPEIDRVVAPHRLRLDPSARSGVPAHVTIHVPWLPVESVDAATLAAVRDLARTVEPFDVLFERMCWFGESVLFLAPTPAEPLRALAERSARRWPDLPLYDGEFDAVVPHLTVGATANARADLLQAAQELAELLPLRDRAAELSWLAEGGDGRWTDRERFPLGA